MAVLGPSGSGKTTLIRGLVDGGSGLSYVSPDVSRALRPGESDKLHASPKEFEQRQREGVYILVTEFFGSRYGMPAIPIQKALALPRPSHIVDFPLEAIEYLSRWQGYKKAIVVMCRDESQLAQRLQGSGRGSRVVDAVAQHHAYLSYLRVGKCPDFLVRSILSTDQPPACVIAQATRLIFGEV